MNKIKVVIVGCSVAALETALVIAKNDTKGQIGSIVFVDRDEFLPYPQLRTGVPQAFHTHVPSARWLQIMEELVPGFSEDLDRYQAPLIPWGSEKLLVRFPSGQLPQDHPLGIETRNISRALAESLLREAVNNLDMDIEYITKRDVYGLVMSADGKRVVGVKTRTRGAGTVTESEILGDKVVIASGASDAWVNWLTDAGYEAPVKKVVDAHLTYFSALFDLGEDMPKTDPQLMAATESLEKPYAVAVALIDGGLYLATVFVYRYDGKYPESEEEYLALAESIDPEIAGFLKQGHMVGTIRPYPNCISRRWEAWNLKRWPEDLFVVGDAIIRLNPRFGQGMTLALFEAEELSAALLNGWSAKKYLKRVSAVADFSWQMASMADQRQMRHVHDPEAPELSRVEAIGQAYTGTLEGIMYDPTVAEVFLKVQNYLYPATALFSPPLIAAFLKKKFSK